MDKKLINKHISALKSSLSKCSIGFIILLFIFTISFVLDRITKFLILSIALKAKTIDSSVDFIVEVLPFFNLTLVVNDGVSFGILSGLGAKYYLIATSIVISVIIIFVAVKERIFFNKVAYSLILSGAFGNLFDRIFFDGVIDFLDFFISINNIHYHWPAFNIADSSIFIGVCILIFNNITNKNLTKTKNDVF